MLSTMAAPLTDRHDQTSPAQAVWNSLLTYKATLLACCLLSLAARGQTVFNPLYAIDTYSFAYRQTLEKVYEQLLSQGRFGLAALFWLRDVVGYSGTDVAVSALLFSIILFSAAAILVALAIFETPAPSTVLVFSAMVVLHPFGTEFFHFSEATFGIAFAVFLGSAGVYLGIRSCDRWRWRASAVVFIILGLSIYQTSIACIAATVLMAIASKLYRSGTPPWRGIWREPTAQTLLLVIASLCIYFLILSYLRSAYKIQMGAHLDLSSLLSVSGMITKIGNLLAALTAFYWPIVGLITWFGSILLLSLMACSLVWLVVRQSNERGLQASMWMTMAIGTSVAVALFPQIAGKSVWLVPRVIWPAIIPTAGLITLAWTALTPGVRSLAVPLLLLLGLIYIGSSNHMLYDQRRLNMFDMNEANRIIARLEMLPRFNEAKNLVLVGGKATRSKWLQTTNGDMNMSALAVEWSKLGAIQEATGYRFAEPTIEQYKAANEFCQTSENWPSERSLAITGALAIVCLTKPGG